MTDNHSVSSFSESPEALTSSDNSRWTADAVLKLVKKNVSKVDNRDATTLDNGPTYVQESLCNYYCYLRHSLNKVLILCLFWKHTWKSEQCDGWWYAGVAMGVAPPHPQDQQTRCHSGTGRPLSWRLRGWGGAPGRVPSHGGGGTDGRPPPYCHSVVCRPLRPCLPAALPLLLYVWKQTNIKTGSFTANNYVMRM